MTSAFPRWSRAAAVAVLLVASGGLAGAADEARLGEARRIAAIGGSVTEIVYALGAEDRLAARDSTSVHPPAAQQLPDVGYIRALSPEGVLSVDPDGIIMLEGSGPAEALEVIERARVPIVTVPERYTSDGIVAKIRTVAGALGLERRGEALAARVAADLAAATEQAGRTDEALRVMFILSMQGGRVMASGEGTAAAGIIAMAGGRNALQGFSGYKQVGDEAVIEAAPDVVLMMDRDGEHAAPDADLFSHPAIAATPAGKARNVVRMDGAHLLGFGPRTASAVRALSARLSAIRPAD